ncbi:MAG TPA: amidohydrolase family protein [Acidimicrobiales bacterium]|nr:amidohydrolase family protein [Acidimicrobiales bacterium]
MQLVIRNGTVIDGTGGPARTADVAIDEGVIVEVGRVEGRGAQEIDADGALVTPGFVDIHTHYDGQAVWDERLQPSSLHGVTTVVMTNCGVGFAPVRPQDRDRLVELMEGVEDIPGTAIHEGLTWEWESFGEYLDALERGRGHDIDFAAQVPHGPLRLYVMGDRGGRGDEATPDEIAEMGRLAAEAVDAGALGFTTSRTRNHRTVKGEPTPTLKAPRTELVGIAQALGHLGKGVLQVVSDFLDVDDEFGTVRAMAEESGRPISISLTQVPFAPEQYKALLDNITAANEAGVEVRAQVAPRAVGLLLGLQASMNPFLGNPAYMEIAALPLAERVAAMRSPERRAAILAAAEGHNGIFGFERIFDLGDPPNYEPAAEDSIAARAARVGRTPQEFAYDLVLGDDGRALLYTPFLNYAGGNLDAARELLAHPYTVPGLGDGGAHVGTICDASFVTTLLTHWGRDRKDGRFPLEYLVQQHCRDTARTVGLNDRGVLAPGYRADVNVIDFDNLRLSPPEIHHDLPAGGRRLLQPVSGYKHTVVAGVETYRDGEATGALPGRLIRGAQATPAR